MALCLLLRLFVFRFLVFFSSRRRHPRLTCDWSSDVCSSDLEIRRIVEEAHQLARDILEQHRDNLKKTSEILLKRETIERDEFLGLLEGKSEEEVFGPDEPIIVDRKSVV